METDYMTLNNTLDFLDQCSDKSLLVLGLERFVKDEGNFFPDTNGIADFSNADNMNVESSIIAAKRFLSEYGKDTLERFVVVYKNEQ